MPDFNLTKIEEKIQKFWKTNSILEKSLTLRQAQDKKAKKFIFYEGPPTANGLPHIGHFLTRAFKDLFIRYKVMRGFFVPRRAGWDTHGLPVEIEVEKKLGLKNKKEIEKYGIAEFNKKAKESAQEYKTEWEKFSKRIGFWLDFDNPYITYENDYIETLWQIVKQFDKKKFLYKSHKVLPFCPRCGTALSSHEVALGYETITEDSVIVKFQIIDSHLNDIALKWEFPNPKNYILSWTTTPWTLPGNVALAVNPNITYSIISKDGESYILAEDLAEKVLEQPYKIEKTLKGKDLVGLSYEPLFKVQSLKSDKSYKVYPADFVSIEEGTGVVHTAVMYGEEDYQLGEKVGLPKHHTVDKDGKFTKDVPEFAGKFVKDAENGIVEYLKSKNLLFKVEPYTHEYPFCWRCKTPLLYYAADSWFVKTTAVKRQLIANNQKINWIPEYIKEGRFGQWLKEVKDWAFSRDRYWGTPLPVWVCGCGNYLVIGSLEELEKYRHKKSNQYFILRHAESTKNIDGEINNSKLEKDIYDLTKKGEAQANKIALELKKKFAIDLIYSSPFLRARRTAEIIAQKIGHKVKVDLRLKEVDYGSEHEGLEPESFLPELPYPEYFSRKLGIDGESRDEVKKRVFDFIKEMEGKHEGKNILVVSHGDPLWLFEGIAKGITDRNLFQIKSRKQEVKGVDLKPLKTGEFRFFKFNNYPRNEFGNLDLHRPFVDEVILKCPDCGGKMKRVPEVIDVWFDSGSMPFATAIPQRAAGFAEPSTSQSVNSKFRNIDISSFDFPADFITEGVDQTRGWFYTLLAVSTLLGFGPPYKNVISLGHVLDKDGKKMSKSLGNVITPDYVIEKFGADAARWWFYKVSQAGEAKSFREEELKEINNGLVRTLVNSLRFWQLYGEKIKNQKSKIKITTQNSKLNLLDGWLLSKWNSLVESVTESLNEYDATLASREIEKFVIEDLSNWWIRRSRDKFQSKESGYQKDLLRFILLELAKITAPFTPFLAEYLHEELHHGTSRNFDPEGVAKRPYGAGISKYRVSVHFHDWPKVDKKLIDKKLEEEMELVRKIVSLGLAARREKNIKVRQPLASLKVSSFNSDSATRLRRGGTFDEQFQVSEELLNLIKEEVNVKNIEFSTHKGSAAGGENLSKELSVVLDTEITSVLKAEGWVREFVRIIQDARKDAGYKYDDRVNAFWFTEDKSLSKAIKREEKFIKQKTVLKEFRESRHNPKFAYDIEKEQELDPGRKIWLGLKK